MGIQYKRINLRKTMIFRFGKQDTLIFEFPYFLRSWKIITMTKIESLSLTFWMFLTYLVHAHLFTLKTKKQKKRYHDFKEKTENHEKMQVSVSL